MRLEEEIHERFWTCRCIVIDDGTVIRTYVSAQFVLVDAFTDNVGRKILLSHYADSRQPRRLCSASK